MLGEQRLLHDDKGGHGLRGKDKRLSELRDARRVLPKDFLKPPLRFLVPNQRR
jgi:hypothetical protein